MKTISNILFAGLSWEERSFLGIKEDCKHFNQTKKVFLFVNISGSHDENQNKAKIQEYCKKKHIHFELVELNYEDPFFTWKRLESLVDGNHKSLKKPVVDISTIPREVIWTLIFFLRKYCTRVDCIYHSPKKYTKKWLSKEPKSPRLLLKHSGISEFNKPTAVLLITGFDEIRTRKLVDYYEPKLMVLGIQQGNQFENKVRNSKEKHLSAIKGQTDLKTFTIDAFSKDFGLSIINSEIKKLKEKYNIIACSQGPKPTSIALYKSQLSHSYVALCYVPSGDFSREYSFGIDRSYKYELDF